MPLLQFLLFILCALLEGLVVPSSPSSAADSPYSPQTTPSQTAPDSADRILAIVNGEIITQTDIERAQRETVHQTLPISLPGEGPGFPDEKSYTPSQALQREIDHRFLLQLALARGIRAEPDEIDRMVLETKKRLGTPSEEAFQRALSEQGFNSIEGYRETLKNQIALLKLIDRELRSKIVITEDEIRDYTNQHRDTLRSMEETRIAMIFLPLPKDASTSDRQEVIEQAKKVEGLLKDGVPFPDAAKQYSRGPEAGVGGDLGYFSPGDLSPLFESEAAKLRKGEISGILTSPQGFHILQVADRRTGKPLSLVDAKKQSESLLFQMKYEQSYQVWFHRQRSNANIEIFP